MGNTIPLPDDLLALEGVWEGRDEGFQFFFSFWRNGDFHYSKTSGSTKSQIAMTIGAWETKGSSRRFRAMSWFVLNAAPQTEGDKMTCTIDGHKLVKTSANPVHRLI